MVTISVCIGSACHLKGAHNVIKAFQKIIEERQLADKVELKAAFCLGECTKAVSVKVNEEQVFSVNENSVIEFFETHIAGRL